MDSNWLIRTLARIDVSYREHLDGGGLSFGQDYIALFKQLRLPKQRRLFEWCAGPGFIGFSLLGHGFCESLSLADINPEAVRACERTVESNGLSDKVAVYLSDALDAIPASESWNLVVANPPHFSDMSRFAGPREGFELRAHDAGWTIHRRFYHKLASFLAPGGVAVLQECNLGSVPSDFANMIASAGLSVVFNVGGKEALSDNYYFLGVARSSEQCPSWVSRANIPYPCRIPASQR